MVIRDLRLLDVGTVTSDDFISGSDQNESAVLIPTEQMTTQRALARRLNVVLFDLRVDRVLPDQWVTPTEDGLGFEHLTVRQADRLVRALEGVAGFEPDRTTPGPDQLSFVVDSWA